MNDALFLSLAIVLTSALVCGAVMLLFLGLGVSRRSKLDTPELSEADAVFVFRDDDLVDCSDRGRQLITSLTFPDGQKLRELELLLQFLEPRFSDLRQELQQLVVVGVLELSANDGSGLVLTADRRKGLTHLRLTDTHAEGALVALDRLSFVAMREELSTLRDMVGHVPVLAWRCDTDGHVVWANSAYLDVFLEHAQGHSGLTWPLPDLFGDQKPDEHDRLSLELSGKLAWFSHLEAKCESGVLHFATPIDLAVQTETSRREMLQVLTRTFASLPTGLALFDKELRLQIFNPALVDLMGLDPLFLAARPSLEEFLYTLRELRMLPEPKDFSAWRTEIAELERAAQMGVFNDEWCLDTGRVFQVTGRPQPGGALAFFFEDVTSDAALARSLRAEIDIGQAVFDGLQDAVIVFNRAGDTLLSNLRYSQIFGEVPCENLADTGLQHALGLWSQACASSVFWPELMAFANTQTQRQAIKGSVCHMDGTSLAVHARWLRHDCLMVTFRALVQDAPRDMAKIMRHKQALAAPDILERETTPRVLANGAHRPVDQEIDLLPDRQNAQTLSQRTRLVQHSGSRPRMR